MSKIMLSCVSASIIALTGCTTTNPLAFRPTMGSDATELGIEAQALINTLQMAYDRNPGCDAIIVPSRQNTDKESFKRLSGSNAAKGTNDFSCYRFKQVASDTLTAKDYYDAGLTLSDIYCDDYFRRIAQRKQIRQFGRSTTNDIGTAASAGLGLLSAGSVLTGGVSALFGLSDNLYRNYDSAFVVEPNLGKMLKLVKTAQSASKASVDPAEFSSYLEAHRAVANYAQQCSYVGMDALLDRAIEAGTQAAALATSMTTDAEVTAAVQKQRIDAAEKTLDSLERKRDLDAKIDALTPSP